MIKAIRAKRKGSESSSSAMSKDDMIAAIRKNRKSNTTPKRNEFKGYDRFNYDKYLNEETNPPSADLVGRTRIQNFSTPTGDKVGWLQERNPDKKIYEKDGEIWAEMPDGQHLPMDSRRFEPVEDTLDVLYDAGTVGAEALAAFGGGLAAAASSFGIGAPAGAVAGGVAAGGAMEALKQKIGDWIGINNNSKEIAYDSITSGALGLAGPAAGGVAKGIKIGGKLVKKAVDKGIPKIADWGSGAGEDVVRNVFTGAEKTAEIAQHGGNIQPYIKNLHNKHTKAIHRHGNKLANAAKDEWAKVPEMDAMELVDIIDQAKDHALKSKGPDSLEAFTKNEIDMANKLKSQYTPHAPDINGNMVEVGTEGVGTISPQRQKDLIDNFYAMGSGNSESIKHLQNPNNQKIGKVFPQKFGNKGYELLRKRAGQTHPEPKHFQSVLDASSDNIERMVNKHDGYARVFDFPDDPKKLNTSKLESALHEIQYGKHEGPKYTGLRHASDHMKNELGIDLEKDALDLATYQFFDPSSPANVQQKAKGAGVIRRLMGSGGYMLGRNYGLAKAGEMGGDAVESFLLDGKNVKRMMQSREKWLPKAQSIENVMSAPSDFIQNNLYKGAGTYKGKPITTVNPYYYMMTQPMEE